MGLSPKQGGECEDLLVHFEMEIEMMEILDKFSKQLYD